MFNPKLNTLICQICGEALLDQKHFYLKHKIKQAEYYQNRFPRHDLLTNETLPFKDLEHYKTLDFLNKNNLKEWLKISKIDEVKLYLKEIIQARKIEKSLVYIPTQVELRSLPNFPSIITFNKIFGDYYKFCEELGFKSRGFINPTKKIPHVREDPFGESPVILIDTREQNWLKLQLEFEIATLTYGDYCLKNSKYKIFIERKGLTDAISSFTLNRERFENELKRATEDNAYLVVLVEDSLSNMLSFNHLPWVSKKIKLSPEFVLHNIRELIQQYQNCQFIFVPGRKIAVKLVEKILLSQNLARMCDLQLLFDTKVLN